MAKLLDHEYDGIQEYDNPIPTWLAALFYATTLFGIGYAIYYPSFWFYNGISDWSSTGQYERQMETAEERYAPLRAAAEKRALEALAGLVEDPATLEAGKEVFGLRCAPCHGQDGAGKIGPSLTDAEWIYGGDAKNVLTSVREGRPKGMPAWKTELNDEEIRNVTAFVLSLSPGTGETSSDTPADKATPEATATPEAAETPVAAETPAAAEIPVAAETPQDNAGTDGEE